MGAKQNASKSSPSKFEIKYYVFIIIEVLSKDSYKFNDF